MVRSLSCKAICAVKPEKLVHRWRAVLRMGLPRMRVFSGCCGHRGRWKKPAAAQESASWKKELTSEFTKVRGDFFNQQAEWRRDWFLHPWLLRVQHSTAQNQQQLQKRQESLFWESQSQGSGMSSVFKVPYAKKKISKLILICLFLERRKDKQWCVILSNAHISTLWNNM